MPKIKIRPNYSKINSDRNNIERTEHTQHTDKRQSEEGYFEDMAGETVQVHFLSGKEIEGTLRASNFNRYDVVLENEEGRYLVPKAAIEYVRCSPDTKEVIRK